MTSTTTRSPQEERKPDKDRRRKSVIKKAFVPLLTVALSIGGSYLVSNYTIKNEIQEFISKEKRQGQVVYDNIALQYFSSLSDLTEITIDAKKQKSLTFKTDKNSRDAYVDSYNRTLTGTLDYIDWVIKNPLAVEDKSKVVRLSHLRNYILLESFRLESFRNSRKAETILGPSQEVLSFMCDLLHDSTTLQDLIQSFSMTENPHLYVIPTGTLAAICTANARQ